MRKSILATLILATPIPAVAQEEAALGPMAAQLRNRVGNWCVEARLQFAPESRALTVVATAESRFLGGRWLVTELRGMDGRGGFHGLGVNGYDAARGTYAGYWVDGTRGFAVPVEGRFDAATGTFVTRSTEPRRGGGTIEVVSETMSNGPDEETTTFTAPDANGRPFQRMVLRYRRAGTADCPADARTAP